jgi:hypothetical protein
MALRGTGEPMNRAMDSLPCRMFKKDVRQGRSEAHGVTDK